MQLRDEVVRLRVTADEKARWIVAAERAGLDLSAWIRRCAKDVLDVEAANARNDAALLRRVERLGHKSPPQIRRLEARGGDVETWPELDDESGAEA
jgi:hypothetical protein